MLDSRHQRYFAIVSRYHQTPAGKRPQMLAGFIHLASMTDPDPLTRSLVGRFYAREALRLSDVAS